MSRDGESMLELKSERPLPPTAAAGPTRAWLRINVPEEDHARFRADWARAAASRSFHELEHRAIDASGGIRTWVSRATPLLDEKGEVREWIGASADITDQKSAEAKLQSTVQGLTDQLSGG